MGGGGKRELAVGDITGKGTVAWQAWGAVEMAGDRSLEGFVRMSSSDALASQSLACRSSQMTKQLPASES